MTLDELLALLPDNTTGEIDAADLRTIVSELFTASHTQVIRLPYQFATSTAPALGKVNIVWAVGPQTLAVSEQTADGGVLPVALIDGTEDNSFTLAVGDRSVMISGTVDGPSTDQGTYRTFPVTVSGLLGNQPSSNTPMTLNVSAQVTL